MLSSPLLRHLPLHRPRRWAGLLGFLVIGLTVAVQPGMGGITINGFAVGDTAVPVEHLVRATPAKDSILSIDNPEFLAATECGYLSDVDEVVSVTIGETTRAYPLRILVWHEVVNDVIEDQPVVITYSALTGSAMVFYSGRDSEGRPRSFGVSGILYNSCLLFYDRETESLWSQMKMMGISKDYVTEPLPQVVSQRMPWGAWRDLHPQGEVLSLDTGYGNDYLGDWPYGDYAEQPETIFPFDINPDRNEFATKERVVGILANEQARAWSFRDLQQEGELFDTVGGYTILLRFVPEKQDVVITDVETGQQLPHLKAYWFAWQAFYPETSVWLPNRMSRDARRR